MEDEIVKYVGARSDRTGIERKDWVSIGEEALNLVRR